MIVGIPGTGIGGLFYLMSALWLPVRGLFRRVRGVGVRLPSTFRQAALALGILGGLWLTGEMLGTLLMCVLPHAGPDALGAHASRSANLLRVASLALGVGTLLAVLATVRLARVFVRRTVPAVQPNDR